MTMTFTQALRHCLSVKYCSTKGRASRSEYWWFLLFATVAGSVLESLAESGGGLAIAAGLASLALVLPQICVASRRLHDIGWSGWWQLMPLALIFAGILSVAVDGSGILCILLILVGMGFGLFVGLRRGTPPGAPNPYGSAPDSFTPSAEGNASNFDPFRVEEEPQVLMICPNCGRAFAEGDKFCGGCGRAYPEAPRCSGCGQELAAGSSFCTHCGRKLEDDAPAGQA